MYYAVVYRPPKPNKDFINEFAHFLGGIVTQFDRLLIVGNFNIHVCCDTNHLEKDFTSLIDSFDLVQMVKGPTHSLGHTLDLVLVYGLSICDLEICELSFSDHKPVMFTCSLSGQISKVHKPVLWSRIFSPTVNEDLSAHFNEAYQLYSLDPSFNNSNAEQQLIWFNSTCFDILDSIAPLRKRQQKFKAEPWLNNTTQALRQVCRHAEQKWKKVSLEILCTSLSNYRKAVKAL